MTSKFDALPVLTEEGYRTGKFESERYVHNHQLWHPCVNICVTDGQGNIYQQLRGGPEYTHIFPYKYDMFLASDHVIQEDEVLEAAVQRAFSLQVGIPFKPEQLLGLQPHFVTKSIYSVQDPSFVNAEGTLGYRHYAFEYIYVVRIDGIGTTVSLNLRRGKVLQVRRYHVSRLWEDFHANHTSSEYTQHAHRTPNDLAILRSIYERVMELSD
jgi:hypothetical protein